MGKVCRILMENVLTRDTLGVATNLNRQMISCNYKVEAGYGTGKNEHFCATGTGSDMPVQLEVAIPAASAGVPATP
jgi:hypothetical protein